jgi:hypothetical protein
MPLLSLAPMLRLYEVSPTGAPLVGGKLYTALPSTTAGPFQSFPKATYSNAGGTPNTNPVVLDGSGKADVWLLGNYNVALYDSVGVLIESGFLSAASIGGSSGQGVDNISFYDATLATVNVTIASANESGAGPQVIVKTDNSINPVVITPTTGTILGQASYSLTNQNEPVSLVPQSTTNDWKVV